MLKSTATDLDDKMLGRFAQHIHHDGVVCYPTEGVWGLGCHPLSASAFARLLTSKQRPRAKGVILVAANIEQIQPYVEIDALLRQQLARYWPGFVSCILPASPDCPSYLTGQHHSLAVRVTAYPPLRALCLHAQTAIVSSSANISGQPPVTTLQQAKRLFGQQVDYYVDAPTGGENKPSRIIQFVNGKKVLIRD